jgi:hypothetical protein
MLDPVDDQVDDQLVGDELARVHVALGREAELAALLLGRTEDVAGRDVRQAEVVLQPSGLGALAGAGRAEEDEVELTHRRGNVHD